MCGDSRAMRAWKYIISVMSAVLVSVLPVSAAGGGDAGQEEGFSAKELVLGHFEDSYWWHIGTFGQKEVSLYLPVILHSPATGWHCFSSRKLYEGASYLGFSIAPEGKYEGKVVETLSDGSVVRPFDLSLTRTAAALLLNSAIVPVPDPDCGRTPAQQRDSAGPGAGCRTLVPQT